MNTNDDGIDNENGFEGEGGDAQKAPRRTRHIVYGAAVALGLLAGAAGIATAATRDSSHDTSYKSSVTVPDDGHEKSDAEEAAQLESVAKITEDQAKAAATAAVPGTVVKVELENEDGNVVYDVEVKAADGKITEVIVDAGNGKVLHQEAEDDDDDSDHSETNRGREQEQNDMTTDTVGGTTTEAPTGSVTEAPPTSPGN